MMKTLETNYTAGRITLNGLVDVEAQYLADERWNGWLIPWLDAWAVEKVLAVFALDRDYGYDWDWLADGSLVLLDRQARVEYPDNPEWWAQVLPPNGDGLYPLGAWAWTWSEDRDEEEA